ncbi:tRNA 2-thiocytidine biosynthesis protein TtcA [Histomonas meleagridis]|uniref:tRNA 2-thiocytidine biosynthesis protein TtcA n=1 Tax=Histomonas meleagridis TaxID=135588 RepID=UPI0035597CC6|nr:tRNA 2-thiocytidine biosynthesis protein TtcA [Histomonas meleagridis]KAH0799786.1 tRNA 2-thiocytidine biosynthesis protein TtcA [Histomonas meleagridis]
METKLRRLFNQACDEFELISKGDRVLVGLSGGKDSLTLVHFLSLLAKEKPGTFHIIAAFIRFTNLPYTVDLPYMQTFCDERNVEFHIVEDQIREGHMTMQSGTCIHCSRYRRAKLMELANVYKCNKLALGHHLDDIIATLLMNMSQHGRFGGMAVKLQISVGETNYPLTMIRPLALIPENDIRSFIKEKNFHPEQCRCPWGDSGYRGKTRDVVDFLCKDDESIRMNLFRSQFNINEKHIEKEKEAIDIEDTPINTGNCYSK